MQCSLISTLMEVYDENETQSHQFSSFRYCPPLQPSHNASSSALAVLFSPSRTFMSFHTENELFSCSFAKLLCFHIFEMKFYDVWMSIEHKWWGEIVGWWAISVSLNEYGSSEKRVFHNFPIFRSLFYVVHSLTHTIHRKRWIISSAHFIYSFRSEIFKHIKKFFNLQNNTHSQVEQKSTYKRSHWSPSTLNRLFMTQQIDLISFSCLKWSDGQRSSTSHYARVWAAVKGQTLLEIYSSFDNSNWTGEFFTLNFLHTGAPKLSQLKSWSIVV